MALLTIARPDASGSGACDSNPQTKTIGLEEICGRSLSILAD